MKLSLERAEARGGGCSLSGSFGGRPPQSSGDELGETPGKTALPTLGTLGGDGCWGFTARGEAAEVWTQSGSLIPDSETWWTSNGRKEVEHIASNSIRQPCTF